MFLPTPSAIRVKRHLVKRLCPVLAGDPNFQPVAVRAGSTFIVPAVLLEGTDGLIVQQERGVESPVPVIERDRGKRSMRRRIGAVVQEANCPPDQVELGVPNRVADLSLVILLNEGKEIRAGAFHTIPNSLSDELVLAALPRVRRNREVPVIGLADRQGCKLMVALQDGIRLPESEINTLLDLENQALLLLHALIEGTLQFPFRLVPNVGSAIPVQELVEGGSRVSKFPLDRSRTGSAGVQFQSPGSPTLRNGTRAGQQAADLEDEFGGRMRQ